MPGPARPLLRESGGPRPFELPAEAHQPAPSSPPSGGSGRIRAFLANAGGLGAFYHAAAD